MRAIYIQRMWLHQEGIQLMESTACFLFLSVVVDNQAWTRRLRQHYPLVTPWMLTNDSASKCAKFNPFVNIDYYRNAPQHALSENIYFVRTPNRIYRSLHFWISGLHGAITF